MPFLTHLTTLTQLTHRLHFDVDDWSATSAIEFLVDNGSGQWDPYLVVQADLSGWDMYEVEA
jgi:hypothetical protein